MSLKKSTLQKSTFWTLVSTGGRILDAFMMLASPYQLRRRFMSHLAAIQDDNTFLVEEEDTYLLNAIKSKFYMFVLHQLMMKGRSANLQMFLLSLMMMGHGVSRAGMKVYSSFGLSVALSTHDLERSRWLRRYNDQIT